MAWIQKAVIGTLAMIVIGVLGIGKVDQGNMIDIIERHNES